MTYFHGLGRSVMDRVISNTLVLNCITNFEILNGFELDSDHKPLSLSLNLVMHTTHMQETSERKRNIWFDKSKANLFLRDLESDLGSLAYNSNIDQMYYHLATTLSTSIRNFSNEKSYKQNNKTSNPWYDKDCKISKKAMRDDPNEIIKLQNNISIYKSLIKRKKRSYIN